MSKLKLGELFAGFGGLGMAVEEVFGAELTWYAEFDDAPSKIMAHHWPGVPNHRDVTTVDWAQVAPVDIISGGSPCQDLSAAGRRAGMTEGTRSNLWVSMREAIATIKPTYVVWENVRGAYSAKASSASDLEPSDGSVGTGAGDNLRALGRVLGDLADLGYDCQWRGLRAADVGAPHGRYRVFILATRRGAKPSDPYNAGLERQRDSSGTASTERRGHIGAGANPGVSTAEDSDRATCGQRRQPASGQEESGWTRANFGGRGGAPAGDAEMLGRDEVGSTGPEEHQRREREGTTRGSSGTVADPEHDGHVASAGGRGDGAATASRAGQERVQTVNDGEPTRGHTPDSEPGRIQTNWGVYAPAIRRWETLRGTAPAPTELTAKGKHRLNAEFASWMMGLEPGHVTGVPGLTRNEQLKAIGNGVCPQQATAALKHMLEVNK